MNTELLEKLLMLNGLQQMGGGSEVLNMIEQLRGEIPDTLVDDLKARVEDLTQTIFKADELQQIIDFGLSFRGDKDFKQFEKNWYKIVKPAQTT